MKFEKAEPEFSPITITLETRKEARTLCGILAKVAGVDSLPYDLYCRLSDELNNDYVKFTGILKRSNDDD